MVRDAILDVTSYVYLPIEAIQNLVTLEKRYTTLQRKYVQARIELNRLRSVEKENQRLRRMLHFRTARKYEVIPAHVLSQAANQSLTSLTVDHGSEDGVHLLDPVIDAEANLVGKVIAVGKSTALVQILKDRNFRVSVRSLRSRVTGILSYSPREGFRLGNVPLNAPLMPGDSIITSGFSDIFPPDIFVGWVTDVQPELEGYVKSAGVRLATDFNRLEEVLILDWHR